MDTRGTERVQNGEKFSHAVKREVKEEKKREKPGQSLLCLCCQDIFLITLSHNLPEVGRVLKNCTQVKALLEIFTQVKVKVIV